VVVVCAKYAVGSKLFFVIMMQVSMTTNKISPVCTGTDGRLPQGLSGPCDLGLDLGYGSRSYRCADVIEYYLYTKFDKDRIN